jgi:hypothetical protein
LSGVAPGPRKLFQICFTAVEVPEIRKTPSISKNPAHMGNQRSWLTNGSSLMVQWTLTKYLVVGEAIQLFG